MTESEVVWCTTPHCNKQVSINPLTGQWFHTDSKSHYCLPDSLMRANPRGYSYFEGKWEKIQQEEDSVKEDIASEPMKEVIDPYKRFYLGEHSYADIYKDRVLIVDFSDDMVVLEGVETLRLINALQDTINLDVTFKIKE